jgi:hypothetical protein
MNIETLKDFAVIFFLFAWGMTGLIYAIVHIYNTYKLWKEN